MQATPSTWRLLVEAGWIGDGKLKVLCGGEAMPPDLADALLDRCGNYGTCTVRPKRRFGRQSIGLNTRRSDAEWQTDANTQIYLQLADRLRTRSFIFSTVIFSGTLALRVSCTLGAPDWPEATWAKQN